MHARKCTFECARLFNTYTHIDVLHIHMLGRRMAHYVNACRTFGAEAGDSGKVAHCIVYALSKHIDDNDGWLVGLTAA